jgi:hypothetical protein
VSAEGLRPGLGRRAFVAGTAAGGLAASHRARAMGSVPPSLSTLPIPPSGAIGFRLIRHGDVIGSHTLGFQIEGDTLTVQIAVDVLYTLGPIPLVRYTHRNTEIWRNGRLSGLDSRTNKNGTELHMSAHRIAAGLQVEGSGTSRPYIAPEDALPTTYWNARMLQGPMIGTQDGILVRPRVTQQAMEKVRLASGSDMEARCYTLRGDLDLDLWYAAESDWVSMRFTVADGSVIRYERL